MLICLYWNNTDLLAATLAPLKLYKAGLRGKERVILANADI
jgi:hypothetical protein